MSVNLSELSAHKNNGMNYNVLAGIDVLFLRHAKLINSGTKNFVSVNVLNLRIVQQQTIGMKVHALVLQ